MYALIIITVFTGGSAGPTSVTSVPGFTSAATCHTAGDLVAKVHPGVRYECIQIN